MTNEELVNYFDDQLFLPDLKAKTKDELFEEIIDQFVKIKYFKNKNIILEMLHQRERLGSTGIGKKVAIPHGRSTSASDILIAFGKSVEGIDYDAIDGAPVDLLFALLVPDNSTEEHLEILSLLAEMFRNQRFREQLRNADESQTAFSMLVHGVKSHA